MEIELGAVQERFADLIWEREPIDSGELVKLCTERFEWKKSTTYTVLRKLCEKGLFVNENGTVRACMQRDAFYAKRSKQIVADSFRGSLPAFFAAFLSDRGLSENEAEEIRTMIDAYRKGE